MGNEKFLNDLGEALDNAPDLGSYGSFAGNYLARLDMFNPYPSLAKHDFRRDRFLREQKAIAPRLGITPEQVDAWHDDLAYSGFTGLMYYFGGHQAMTTYLIEKVFGSIIDRAETLRYTGKDGDKTRKWVEIEQNRPSADRVFFAAGLVVDNSDKANPVFAAHLLRKRHLSPYETAQCANRAVELYDVFEFSELHYRRMNRFNFFGKFLQGLSETISRLDPAKAPVKPGWWDSF